MAEENNNVNNDINENNNPSDVSPNLYENQLRKKAKLLNKELRRKNLMIRMAIIITIFFIICYAALNIAQKYSGSFEIDLNNGRRTLSLSETPDFLAPTDLLDAKIPEKMNNISYTTLPFETMGTKDGSDNGENYLCYTFYLKNTGNRKLDYISALKIMSYDKGLDECIRVMILRNDEKYYYAKAKMGSDGEPELVYYYDDHALFDETIVSTPFKSLEECFSNERDGLEVGEIDKFTILIWIEGSDPETTNEKITGVVRLKWDFKVIENNEDEEDL